MVPTNSFCMLAYFLEVYSKRQLVRKFGLVEKEFCSSLHIVLYFMLYITYPRLSLFFNSWIFLADQGLSQYKDVLVQ